MRGHDRPEFISVDEHVQEPPDLWESRLSKAKWGDRIPHLSRQRDRSERWVVDGAPLDLPGAASAGALMPERTREPQRWDEVPPMAYSPAERLKAMDADGVDYAVLYPTIAGASGETFGRITDPELELACVQAYNDWLIEEWAASSDRFIPQCIVPLYPAEAAAAEIRRAVALGHRGVIYPSVPMKLRDVPHINEPEYDPIWSTCQELAVPLCFHSGAAVAGELQPYGMSDAVAGALRNLTRPASTGGVMVNFLMSGALTRFPELQVVFSETGLGWATYLLEYADHQFAGDKLAHEGYALTPSQVFRRQCYVTGWYDQISLKIRHLLGVENILWSTNFPLATSTWPKSWDTIRGWGEDVTPEDRDRILWRNAAKLYKIS